jgi:heptosyltransferase-2
VKLAVIKPDHIGDLILSAPAITALVRAHPDLVLFVSPKCLGLAAYLFPGVELAPITFGHLDKSASGASQVPDFSGFDLTCVLRRDGVVNPDWARLRLRDYVMIEDDHHLHQSLLDYAPASRIIGDYDIDGFLGDDGLASIQKKATSRPQRVALSIGSGFYANAWPVTRWIDFGKAVQALDMDVVVVGGGGEATQAGIIGRSLGLKPAALRLGGSDFGAFLDQLDDVDLTVASDGGTAHLCSLRTPVLSIFGPSPHRRYAPFGRWNRLITRALACSPCCQYARALVNGCLTNECTTSILPRDAIMALNVPLYGDQRAYSVPLRAGLKLFVGTSHLDRPVYTARARKESAYWPA